VLVLELGVSIGVTG